MSKGVHAVEASHVLSFDKYYWHATDKERLHYATLTRALLAHGADARIRMDEYNDTPLHKAAEMVLTDLAEVLIIQGFADVDAPNDDGSTPLHAAAEIVVCAGSMQFSRVADMLLRTEQM